MYQLGGCIAAPIPSTFGLHPNTPGETYLHSSAALAVRSLAAAFGERVTPSNCGAWRRMVCACHFTQTIQGIIVAGVHSLLKVNHARGAE